MYCIQFNSVVHFCTFNQIIGWNVNKNDTKRKHMDGQMGISIIGYLKFGRISEIIFTGMSWTLYLKFSRNKSSKKEPSKIYISNYPCIINILCPPRIYMDNWCHGAKKCVWSGAWSVVFHLVIIGLYFNQSFLHSELVSSSGIEQLVLAALFWQTLPLLSPERPFLGCKLGQATPWGRWA